jgi:hypothetical protein
VLLGVRHHGPGSARAVRRALAAYQPEAVLIEGPPEADGLLGLAAAEQMRPPVALLAYTDSSTKEGRRAAYWPFAEFSPEWQAIRWALAGKVPVRFCDLPAATSFAAPSEISDGKADEQRADPIGALARAGGYDDPERWWEDVVEHRVSTGPDSLAEALAPFQAIAEAMAAVRADAPPPPPAERLREDRREAYMRTALRAATKQHQRVAVVCGAWHVPALTPPLPKVGEDATVLKGLSKVKVTTTWVPWTHGRLASWQGYGAGVTSPGWYHHLFTAADRPIIRWLVGVAALLRAEGLPVSGAHVIEAVRLAEALAALRGRPLSGLAEVTEATRAVLCDGDELRLHLVHEKLVVGERLGAVPDDTPSVPLVADVTAAQRRLRMTVSPLISELNLDLRRELDLDRSRLVHRLRLLGVAWGTPAPERRGRGTFWESWQTCWRPEFAIDLVEASGYGTTVVTAATAKLDELSAAAGSLEQVTALVERCLLAELPEAYPTVLRALDERVALAADAGHLMAALPALARTLRYGDVRGTDVTALGTITRAVVVRICVGLPAAVSTLDDDAAAAMRDLVDGVDSALGLLADPDLAAGWQAALAQVAQRDDVNGLLAGRITRLLLDAGRLTPAEAGRRLALSLTIGVPPGRAAAYVEGFLAGGGMLLAHSEGLLSLVDTWLTGIPSDTFVEVLPLLRRTFGTFEGPERRLIGERVRHLTGGPAPAAVAEDVDPDRAELVLPVLRLLLGRDIPSPGAVSHD